MNRSLVLSIAAAAALGALLAWLGGAAQPGTPARPHVVLIVVDTLRADKLGSYGYPRDPSPELDALADRGVRFDHVVAQSPWTRPSIGSFLTSLHPRTVGLYEQKGDLLQDRFTTLAEVLQKHGYVTFGATANPNINSTYNFHQGFDGYVDSNVVFEWMDEGPGQVKPDESRMYRASELFGTTIDLLDRERPENRGRPHYLQFNIMEVHEWGKPRHYVDARFRKLYRDLPMVERRYLWTIRQISHDIDAFIRELTSRPGWEDTLFVLVSDHGEGLLSHPHVPGSSYHGGYLYDSHLRVPWILYASDRNRLPGGKVVRQPVRLLELMPTVLDLIDVPVPPGAVGRSLAPLIEGTGSVRLPSAFVSETRFQKNDKVGIQSPRWLYVENREGNPRLPERELHPVGERQDGVRTDRKADYPELTERLDAALETWERAHPRTPPVKRDRELSDQEAAQLRALGYAE